MVMLFLNKRIHNRDKVNIFQVKSSFFPGFPLSTFFPAFTELQVAPRKLETASSKRPFPLAQEDTARMPAAGHHSSYSDSRAPPPWLHTPVIKPSPVFLMFRITPQIFTLKKNSIQFANIQNLFIYGIFRKMPFKLQA